jgi:hypothetical protein
MCSVYGHTPTRYEMNRHVRNVLTRHGANMELISISCTGRVVYLNGSQNIKRPNIISRNRW